MKTWRDEEAALWTSGPEDPRRREGMFKGTGAAASVACGQSEWREERRWAGERGAGRPCRVCQAVRCVALTLSNMEA